MILGPPVCGSRRIAGAGVLNECGKGLVLNILKLAVIASIAEGMRCREDGSHEGEDQGQPSPVALFGQASVSTRYIRALQPLRLCAFPSLQSPCPPAPHLLPRHGLKRPSCPVPQFHHIYERRCSPTCLARRENHAQIIPCRRHKVTPRVPQ